MNELNGSTMCSISDEMVMINLGGTTMNIVDETEDDTFHIRLSWP